MYKFITQKNIYLAQGSLTELKNQLLISRDIGYLRDNDVKDLADKANGTPSFTTGFDKKIKRILK